MFAGRAKVTLIDQVKGIIYCTERGGRGLGRILTTGRAQPASSLLLPRPFTSIWNIPRCGLSGRPAACQTGVGTQECKTDHFLPSSRFPHERALMTYLKGKTAKPSAFHPSATPSAQKLPPVSSCCLAWAEFSGKARANVLRAVRIPGEPKLPTVH